MFIYDDELRERLGDKADEVIAKLDQDWGTRKSLAKRPEGARSRLNVEKFLNENGYAVNHDKR